MLHIGWHAHFDGGVQQLHVVYKNKELSINCSITILNVVKF